MYTESSDETQICIKLLLAMLSTFFSWKPKIDNFWRNCLRQYFVKIRFSNFVYGISDRITFSDWWSSFVLGETKFFISNFSEIWLKKFLKFLQFYFQIFHNSSSKFCKFVKNSPKSSSTNFSKLFFKISRECYLIFLSTLVKIYL